MFTFRRTNANSFGCKLWTNDTKTQSRIRSFVCQGKHNTVCCQEIQDSQRVQKLTEFSAQTKLWKVSRAVNIVKTSARLESHAISKDFQDTRIFEARYNFQNRKEFHDFLNPPSHRNFPDSRKFRRSSNTSIRRKQSNLSEFFKPS